jgi:predicted RNase H-like HicB family nuclease
LNQNFWLGKEEGLKNNFAPFVFEILFLALTKAFIMKVPLKNIVWKEGDFYVSKCLNVEVASFGNTKEEALKNLQEALDLYFEDRSLDDALTIEQVEIVSTEMEHA